MTVSYRDFSNSTTPNKSQQGAAIVISVNIKIQSLWRYHLIFFHVIKSLLVDVLLIFQVEVAACPYQACTTVKMYPSKG